MGPSTVVARLSTCTSRSSRLARSLCARVPHGQHTRHTRRRALQQLLARKTATRRTRTLRRAAVWRPLACPAAAPLWSRRRQHRSVCVQGRQARATHLYPTSRPPNAAVLPEAGHGCPGQRRKCTTAVTAARAHARTHLLVILLAAPLRGDTGTNDRTRWSAHIGAGGKVADFGAQLRCWGKRKRAARRHTVNWPRTHACACG